MFLLYSFLLHPLLRYFRQSPHPHETPFWHNLTHQLSLHIINRVSHRCREHDGGSYFLWGLKTIHGRSMGGVKMLSKNTCEGVHLIVKLPAIGLQAWKFTKNELLHIYISRILARFQVTIDCGFSRNHFVEGCFMFQGRGGGVVFQMGFIFKWKVTSSVLMGELSKKIRGWERGHPPPRPPGILPV